MKSMSWCRDLWLGFFFFSIYMKNNLWGYCQVIHIYVLIHVQHSGYRLNWQCFCSLKSVLFTQASIKGQVLTWRIHPSAFPFNKTRRMPIMGPLLQPQFPDLLFKLDTWFAEVYGTPTISWGWRLTASCSCLVGSDWMSGWFLTTCQCGQELINWFPKT